MLRRTAARVPDRPALLSDRRCLSWRELDAEVDRVADLLAGLGVSAGDVVGFVVTKRPEVVTGFLACARIGAVVAPVNFKLRSEHVVDQVRTAGISALFAEPGFDAVVGAVVGLLSDSRRIVYLDGPGGYSDSWYGQPTTPRARAFRPDPDTVCYYNYTSGTTGRPKGAITTHRNILHNAVATIEGLGFQADDVFLGMFSVFAHPHELFHRSLVSGGAFVVLDNLSPRVIAQAVERYRVSWMMAVPSLYEMLLDHVAPTGVGGGVGADLGSLRILESGGAYVGPDTLVRMEDAFGCTFVPVWGCTEASGVALANGPGPGHRRAGATGKPVPGYTLRVVRDDGSDCAVDETGELLVAGPAVVSGYVNAPAETGSRFVDGWYHTDDLVHRDADGFYHFTGRRSEMLKIGGIRVYPLEIEKVVGAHPDVLAVVVVRAEDRVRGEVARAVVQVEDGSCLDARGLQSWCRARLAAYKVPRIIEFWLELPRLPSGKIDQRAVAARPVDPTRDER